MGAGANRQGSALSPALVDPGSTVTSVSKRLMRASEILAKTEAAAQRSMDGLNAPAHQVLVDLCAKLMMTIA